MRSCQRICRLSCGQVRCDFIRAHSLRDTYALFADVDMPTALQSLGSPTTSPTSASLVLSAEAYEASEPYHMVPNLYAYFIKTCMLPIRKVQHDLFNLYFRYVHPMFPVVDEYYFNKLHQRFLGHEELLNPLDFMIYQAILAAGFGVSSPCARSKAVLC